MTCSYCASPRTKEQRKITALGYRIFRRESCQVPDKLNIKIRANEEQPEAVSNALLNFLQGWEG